MQRSDRSNVGRDFLVMVSDAWCLSISYGLFYRDDLEATRLESLRAAIADEMRGEFAV